MCLNGGRAALVPGVWGASVEWLVRLLAPRFPAVGFVEVRYRLRSWRRLDWCEEDARGGLALARGGRVALLGYSMGGAVAVRAAGDPRVEAVLGVAPWLPDALDVSTLAGKRLAVVHGSLDRALPGVPGVGPALSRRGFERALAAGADGDYVLVRGATHALALRAPWGGVVATPRARAVGKVVAAELERFSSAPH